MKNKKIIIAMIAVGSILLLGVGLVLKANKVDKNTHKIIQEGKELTKAKTVEEYVDNAFKMLIKHGPMSNEIWDGYDVNNKNILVAERDNDTDKVLRAWKLTTTDKRDLTKSEINEIQFPTVGGYNKVNFENKQGITLSISQKMLSIFSFMDFNYLYEVAVHEMYHFYGDDMKKYDELSLDSQDNLDRYTKFPKESSPRVYRKMVYDNLVLAYENPSEQKLYLGKAKYWNEKWKKGYPEEYRQSSVTDIGEGKARYIEYLMCIDYKGISKEERINSIKSIFNKDIEVLDGVDSESYELGFVSGVLLDNIKPDWKKEIDNQPQRPVEMLLKDIEVVKDDSDHFDKVSKKANSQMEKSNKEIEEKITNIENAESDKNIPLLQLKGSSMDGSFSTTDFIEYKGKIIVVDFGATFKVTDGIAKINEVSSYLSNEEDNVYNLPLTMKYKIENNRLIINEKGVSVDAKVKEVKNKDGRKLYIME